MRRLNAGLAAIACLALARDTLPGDSSAGWDALLARRDRASDAEVLAALKAAGGAPIREGNVAVFVVEGAADSPPRIVGDFNDWGEGPNGAEPRLERIGQTKFWTGRVTLHPAARVEYLVVRRGQEEEPDPLNPRSVAAFQGRHSELRMPGYRPPEWLAAAATPPRGRVESFEHRSPALRNSRQVSVYLPPGYDHAAARRYPTAWLHDGTSYVEAVGVPALADALIGRGLLEPMIVVLVDPVNRRLDYSGSADHRKVIADELVPLLDSRYRTEARPARRAIGGGSRGGLAAIDLALARPDVFGLCAAWAPAIAPATVEAFVAGRRGSGRFVIMEHTYDREWGPDARALRAGLAAPGVQVTYLEVPEGHTLGAWPARVGQALLELFPARP